MKIGIIGALEEELNPIRGFTQHLEKKQKGTRAYWHGDVYGHELFVTRCDVGKVNAAIAAQHLIDHFGVEAIFSMGSSGALSPDLEVGDLVVASECIQHDFDLASWGLQPGDILFDVQLDPASGMKFRSQQTFKTDESLSRLTLGIARKIQLSDVLGHSPKIISGRILSGDQFVSQREKAQGLWTTLNGLCTDMEASAIAHTCAVNNVSFLCVRAISDKADHSATVDFAGFLSAATVNYGKLFEQVLKELSH